MAVGAQQYLDNAFIGGYTRGQARRVTADMQAVAIAAGANPSQFQQTGVEGL